MKLHMTIFVFALAAPLCVLSANLKCYSCTSPPISNSQTTTIESAASAAADLVRSSSAIAAQGVQAAPRHSENTTKCADPFEDHPASRQDCGPGFDRCFKAEGTVSRITPSGNISFSYIARGCVPEEIKSVEETHDETSAESVSKKLHYCRADYCNGATRMSPLSPLSSSYTIMLGVTLCMLLKH